MLTEARHNDYPVSLLVSCPRLKREALQPHAAQPKSGKWVDKQQLAEELGVSVRTITNWQRRRVLPFTKIGRVVRFDVDRCHEALRALTVQSITPRFQ